jgi:hypothetical protein
MRREKSLSSAVGEALWIVVLASPAGVALAAALGVRLPLFIEALWSGR